MQRLKLNYASKRAAGQFNPSGVKTDTSPSNAMVADTLAFRVAKLSVGMLLIVCNMNSLIFICSEFQPLATFQCRGSMWSELYHYVVFDKMAREAR